MNSRYVLIDPREVKVGDVVVLNALDREIVRINANSTRVKVYYMALNKRGCQREMGFTFWQYDGQKAWKMLSS